MQQSTDVDQHYCHRKSRMLQLFWQAFHGTEGDTIIRSIPINIPIIVVICNPSSYCILSILQLNCKEHVDSTSKPSRSREATIDKEDDEEIKEH